MPSPLAPTLPGIEEAEAGDVGCEVMPLGIGEEPEEAGDGPPCVEGRAGVDEEVAVAVTGVRDVVGLCFSGVLNGDGECLLLLLPLECSSFIARFGADICRCIAACCWCSAATPSGECRCDAEVSLSARRRALWRAFLRDSRSVRRDFIRLRAADYQDEHEQKFDKKIDIERRVESSVKQGTTSHKRGGKGNTVQRYVSGKTPEDRSMRMSADFP